MVDQEGHCMKRLTFVENSSHSTNLATTPDYSYNDKTQLSQTVQVMILYGTTFIMKSYSKYQQPIK